MPAVSPALNLGIQTLGEAIQLTPAPPVLGIISTAQNILQMINDDKSANQDEQRLAQMIMDIVIAYSDGMNKLGEIACRDWEMERISKNLHTCLESISKAIQNQTRVGLVTRMLTQSATRQRIKGWLADLEQIALHFTVIVDHKPKSGGLSSLQIEIQARTAKVSPEISLESKEAVMQGIPTMEERVQQANQEDLYLIKSQVLKETRKKLHKNSFGHFPPTASLIFYGRSHEVNWLVESLINVPAYHAILGPGGIGKTSVALNALHDPRTIEVYGKHRYFLACETTSDAGGIIAGLADIFSLNEGAFLEQFKRLCRVIGSNILFLLDNFETPWEQMEARQKVEDLLTDLSNIPNLSIVVTLRGAERPVGIRWSYPFLPVLGPLDVSAACQTFATIADTDAEDPDLIKLMEAVEFMPLAITLLAAQASYTTCAFLLEQWQIRKTSMITRGWDSRLSSLDVSISLSLTSSRFTSNPQALSLLQILSLLPDGATVEELREMTSDDFDIHKSASTLLQVALAATIRHDRIHVIAPIREYIKSKHPISSTLLQPVFSYHAELCHFAGASRWASEARLVDDKLNPCLGNIHYVLGMCLRLETLSDEALNASIRFASVRRQWRSGTLAAFGDALDPIENVSSLPFSRHSGNLVSPTDAVQYVLAANSALTHLTKCESSIREVLALQGVAGDTAVLAGFDEGHLRRGVGLLETIYVIISEEVLDPIGLCNSLGQILRPYPGVILTPTQSHCTKICGPHSSDEENDIAILKRTMLYTNTQLSWPPPDCVLGSNMVSFNNEPDPVPPIPGGWNGENTARDTGGAKQSSSEKREGEKELIPSNGNPPSDDSGEGARGSDPSGSSDLEQSQPGEQIPNHHPESQDSNNPDPESMPGRLVRQPTAYFNCKAHVFLEKDSSSASEDKASQRLRVIGHLECYSLETPCLNRLLKPTIGVKFTGLSFQGLSNSKTATYRQTLARISMNVHEHHIKIDAKPIGTQAYDGNSKENYAIAKGSTTTGSGTIGWKAVPTFLASLAHTRATETSLSKERVRCESRVIMYQEDEYVYWVLLVDDPHQQQTGLNLAESPGKLPRAVFEFYQDDTALPTHVDIEVESFWSLLSGLESTKDLEKLQKRKLLNVSHWVQLKVPSNLSESSNQKPKSAATMDCKGSRDIVPEVSDQGVHLRCGVDNVTKPRMDEVKEGRSGLRETPIVD